MLIGSIKCFSLISLYRVFKKGRTGATYNIGSNKNLTNKDLVKKIISICIKLQLFDKISKIIFVKDRPGHDLRYALNSNKIKNQLKWSSKIKINQGLLRTITWYKDNRNFYKLTRNKKYFQRLGKKR